MKINLLAIGTRMPAWVNEGYKEYASRLPKEFSLTLIEVSAQKRGKNAALSSLLDIESEQLFKALPENNYKIALDRQGKVLDTLELAQKLNELHQQSQNLSLLIGGPEGISPNFLKKTDELWSLSALTLPHPLVRVLIAEQIYRAWSILNHHPYHR